MQTHTFCLRKIRWSWTRFTCITTITHTIHFCFVPPQEGRLVQQIFYQKLKVNNEVNTTHMLESLWDSLCITRTLAVTFIENRLIFYWIFAIKGGKCGCACLVGAPCFEPGVQQSLDSGDCFKSDSGVCISLHLIQWYIFSWCFWMSVIFNLM